MCEQQYETNSMVFLYLPQFANTFSIEISIANLQQKNYNKILHAKLYENQIVIYSYTITTTSFAIT